MPAAAGPPSQAAKRSARHLFRELLRAATYLPDEFARTYIHNHIVRRFRKDSVITAERLKNARQSVSLLQRAAAGELKPLSKVLLDVYGRSGRRRRELITALRRPQSQTLYQFNEDIDAAVNAGAGSDEQLRTSSPPFDAFLKFQKQHRIAESPRPTLRHISPDKVIQKIDIFGRPLTPTRERNLKHEFWADAFNRLLPPLPESEWNRLRDLSTGKIPFDGSPPRRKPPRLTVTHEGDGLDAFDQDGKLSTSNHSKEYVSDSTKVGDLFTVPIRVSERLSGTHSVEHSLKVHKITPRFMRRLWSSIWNMTPMMTYDSETDKWSVKWGGGRASYSIGKFSSPGKGDAELFEGIMANTSPSTAKKKFFA